MIFRVSKGVDSFFDRVYKNTTTVLQRDELLNSFQLIPSSEKYSPEGLNFSINIRYIFPWVIIAFPA